MRTLFHVAHGVIIGIGAIAVLATLLPGSWRYRRSINRLREAGNSDALIHLAEQRAHAELSGTAKASTRGRPFLVVAALASITAAAIHGAVGPEHFREALRLGLFFVLICAGQLFLAAALLRRPTRPRVAASGPMGQRPAHDSPARRGAITSMFSGQRPAHDSQARRVAITSMFSGQRPAHDSPARRVAITSILVNAGTVLLWILTRTFGLPFELAEIEPFGVLDTISSAAELVVVGCCLRWLLLGQINEPAAKRSPRRPALTALSAHRPEGV